MPTRNVDDEHQNQRDADRPMQPSRPIVHTIIADVVDAAIEKFSTS